MNADTLIFRKGPFEALLTSRLTFPLQTFEGLSQFPPTKPLGKATAAFLLLGLSKEGAALGFL